MIQDGGKFAAVPEMRKGVHLTCLGLEGRIFRWILSLPEEEARMGRSRIWSYSACSGFKAFALAALLASGRAGAEEPWSEPVVSTYNPQPGVTERLEVSKRTYQEGPSQRVLERRTKVNLETPGLSGEYVLYKKHVYSGFKLLTGFRKLEADLGGEASIALSEQTQFGKSPRGDIKGTFLREYFLGGRSSGGPAARLMVHFDPYLLVRRFTARISTRKEGAWGEVAEVYAETFPEGVRRLRKKIAALKQERKDPAADFLIALWSGALAQSQTMELAQFVYPLLHTSAEEYFKGLDGDLVADRTQGVLASIGREEEVTRWQAFVRSLSEARSSLEKALRAKAFALAELSRMAQGYAEILQPLLAPKEGAPSAVQGLQASAGWMAKAWAQFSGLEPGSPDSMNFLAGLPEQWAGAFGEQRAEVFKRALYVLQTKKEVKELDSLIVAAAKAPGRDEITTSLQKIRQNLAQSAQAWRTPMAKRSISWRNLLAFWEIPLRLLVGEAWAAGESQDEPEGLADLLPFDAFGVDLYAALLMAGFSPEKAEEIVNHASGGLDYLPRSPVEALAPYGCGQ